jgi:hypothetical protein
LDYRDIEKQCGGPLINEIGQEEYNYRLKYLQVKSDWGRLKILKKEERKKRVKQVPLRMWN